jgi:hypothetical protein
MPPAVAPEGNLGFRGKPSCPLLSLRFLHICNHLGRWPCGFYNKKYLEILAKGRSDVAVGCSKRW